MADDPYDVQDQGDQAGAATSPEGASEPAIEATAEATAEAASAATTETVAATPAENAAAARIAELGRRVAELEAQVERERDQATDYMRHWHTAQADFANYKRRAQQEQEQRDRLLAAQALAPTLNALDSLERAFLALPATLRGFTWIEGIALVDLQLRRALDLQGIQAIEAEPGQSFDPTRHEPIGEVETAEVAEGAIAVVAQRGYESHGLLIRPTLVQLARKPGPKPGPAPEPQASAATADTAVSADDATTATSATAAGDTTDDATEATSRT